MNHFDYFSCDAFGADFLSISRYNYLDIILGRRHCVLYSSKACAGPMQFGCFGRTMEATI